MGDVTRLQLKTVQSVCSILFWHSLLKESSVSRAAKPTEAITPLTFKKKTKLGVFFFWQERKQKRVSPTRENGGGGIIKHFVNPLTDKAWQMQLGSHNGIVAHRSLWDSN